MLMTDIEGSTSIVHTLGPRYRQLIDELWRLLRSCVTDAGGHEVEARADEFFAVFEAPRAAVDAAIAAQHAVAAHAWPESTEVRVRIGLHSGYPTSTADNYVGTDVNTASRICASGHGGQIVVSASTREAVKASAPDGIRFTALGSHRLRGLPDAVPLYQITAKGLRAGSRRCGRCSAGGGQIGGRGRGAALVGARRPQHEGVGEHRPDELQPDRQTVARQAARDRAGRLLGEVERIRERRPAEHRLGRQRGVPGRPGLERRHGHRRRDEEVEALHELPHARPSSPRRRFSRWTSRLLSRDPSSASAAKSGSVTACCSGVNVFHSVQAPVNQRPVVISSGSSKPGSTASTIAPAAARSAAAAATAAATSGSTPSA